MPTIASPVSMPHVSTERALLACGVASSVIYIAANIAGSMAWPEYRSASQTISELSAIDAPSSRIWVPLGLTYDVLLVAFGVGLWRVAPRARGLRVAGGLLIAIALIGPFWPPMHLRGTPTTLTDTLHVVWAAVTSGLILLAIAFGSTGLGKAFRAYSYATLAVLLGVGALTFEYAPRVAANLPTPWLGVIERVDLGAYLLWVAVLSIVLVRRSR